MTTPSASRPVVRPANTIHHPATDHHWWREAVIYQVYPRSWADGNGDGVGDIPGIIERLPHLAELGVDALWLSPFYKSPQADAGYDVSDYRMIDPIFGDLGDADQLITRARELGLRVIVDIVPNHTSDEHPWFVEALAAGPGSPARSRYLFRDGLGEKGELPPNNWESLFGGSAWERVTEPDGTPGQWYLHLFDVKQADLDWTHPEVRTEFEQVLRFWLDRGVDGFRIDVAHGMVKAEGLPAWDEDKIAQGGGFSGAPFWDQEGVHDIYRSWRKISDEYTGDRVLVAEAWVEPLERLSRYVRDDELHQAFNFSYLYTPWRAADQRKVITESLAVMDSVGATTTWVLSNHDVIRHTGRFGFDADVKLPIGITADDAQPDLELGLRRARAATMVMLALPGSAYLYQGEELGLPEHTTMPGEARQDPTWERSHHERAGRDGCRVPLPWVADAPGAGFGSSDASWLPQPAGWGAYAVDVQRGVSGSTYEMYRQALAARRDHHLGAGDLTWMDGFDESVVAFANLSVLVVANTGTEPVTLPEGEVIMASGPLTEAGDLPADTTVWLQQ
ncbi:MAG: glycoside hydrolase family 13 protein [Actinomycetota bacterium]